MIQPDNSTHHAPRILVSHSGEAPDYVGYLSHCNGNVKYLLTREKPPFYCIESTADYPRTTETGRIIHTNLCELWRHNGGIVNHNEARP